MRDLMQHLRSPFEPDDLQCWGGAKTIAERNATVWLYDAIVSGNTNLVKAMLQAGAEVNSELRRAVLPMKNPPCTPIELAWWLVSHGPEGNEKNVRVDNEVVRDDGIVPLLLSEGAIPPPNILRHVDSPRWEALRQVTFVMLEHTMIHRLGAAQDGALSMVVNPAQRDWMSASASLLPASVVPDTDAHGPHWWLHRAIQSQNWPAVHAWMDLGGVAASVDVSPVLALMWEPMAHFGGAVPQERFDALMRLQASLLTDQEEVYHHEVVSLLFNIDHWRDRGFHPDHLKMVENYLLRLVIERPLTSFLLNTQGGITYTDEQAQRLQKGLIELERKVLKAPLKSVDAPDKSPNRSRVRL